MAIENILRLTEQHDPIRSTTNQRKSCVNLATALDNRQTPSLEGNSAGRTTERVC